MIHPAPSLNLEQQMVSALISALDVTGRHAPTIHEVREKAEHMAPAFEYSGPLDYILDQVLTSVTTTMNPGVSLILPDEEHDEAWPQTRRDINWVYSNAYFDHLRGQKWTAAMRQSLGEVTLELLGLLHDPAKTGLWDRRGLVIGQVQSGKTANYLGLIARAADAGYKLIIVIAGIHNVLRSQTQIRVDEGFVGRDSVSKNPVGVGKNSGYPHPVTVTTAESDFTSLTAQISSWRLTDSARPIVLVIKKNVFTLESLHDWLKTMNAPNGARIASIPMLMIDDEADHASINTNKPECDPTKTNSLIRDIIRLFEQSCYVGYTATPFANIFINPEDYDELYPKDFVHCLDAPSSYFGPEKVFLDNTKSGCVTVPIMDCEDVLPIKHKKDDELLLLPSSLTRAINEFIVARAVKNLRGQAAHPCSMMINVSRFVRIQQRVRDLVREHIKTVQNAIQVFYMMPVANALENPHMRNLKHVLEHNYSGCNRNWEEVRPALHEAAKRIKVALINSSSKDELDYQAYAEGSHGLTVIAVGGLSLSRGLTLDGLCVSYVYRNTRMYDTLMQMGRWFGYRPGYEDLCRVHLSQDAIDWYEHVAEISRELVGQVRTMRARGKTPRDLGFYVRAHPDRLMITSPRKMLLGEKWTLNESYAGRNVEFSTLTTSEAVHARNERLISKFWAHKDLCSAKQPPDSKSSKGWIVCDVTNAEVAQFLRRFEVHDLVESRKSGVVEFLESIRRRYPLCDVLLISPRSRSGVQNPLKLGEQRRKFSKPKDPEMPQDVLELPKKRVASRGDEGLGLTMEQWETADANRLKRRSNSGFIDLDFRLARNRPLLMIHVLKNTGDNSTGDMRMPTICMSFPVAHFDKSVKVVASPTWVKMQRNGVPGVLDPNGEEDDH